jgi:ankyrin repeat protein
MLFSLSPTQDGQTPLFLASGSGNADLVQRLIDGGANINQPSKCNNETNKTTKANKKKKPFFSFFLLVSRTDNQTPFEIACRQGHLKVIGLLIRNGCNINYDCMY